MRPLALCAALLALLLPAASGAVMRHDLAIVDALIVDGGGGPAFRGAVFVDDGRIAAVRRGAARGVRADRTVHARGRVLAPGFIDAHAHGDPLRNASFENFVSMGVTTIVLGQDGETPGFRPPGSEQASLTLAEWMGAAQARGLELNMAALAGHGSLRWESGVGVAPVPDPAQQARMEALLARDLEAGAFGLSSGLEYAPGLYASTPELLGLARVVGRRGGVVMSHMRTEDDDRIDGAISELLEQGRYARVHISHLKVVLGHGPAHARAILRRLREARRAGVQVSADAYPYTAGFADITLVFPPWAKTRAQYEAAMRSRRAELEAFVRGRIEARNGPEAILIASGPLAGKTLKEAAAAAGKPYWVYAVEDMGVDGPNCAHFVQDAELQDVFLTSDLVAIATDGAPWMDHPRSWGTYPRIIEEYVVRRRAMTLEAAVAKMTSVPAAAVGLRGRGRIAPGYAADLVLFEPARVKAHATWTRPRARAEGIDLVLVNGETAYADGALTAARAGRMLKRGEP